MQFFAAATRFSTTVTILIVCLVVLVITVQPAEALSNNMQGSLRQSRNCFFSPMGCIFIPKKSRIRKISSNMQGSLRQSRNCFFSLMGCVFMPKMSRIRKMSNDYDG
ncbi:unnamed protein product [Caenorhabditis bovis]|uniref:Uncharacterized protein n=1 Tax=Caenorhabditis bovis TaxID=2654633 RepID=A0A8S1EXG6_9PELO|nr:unnamed protein product [Caenorhabditis bovis]